MPGFVHTADLHLDSPFSARFDRTQAQMRRREQMQTFQRICEIAKEKELFLISGDLFDGRFVSAETVAFLKRCFAMMPHTRVFLSAGNHDPFLPGCVYEKEDFGAHVHVFGTEMEYVDIPELSLRVHGRSFSQSHEDTPMLSSLSLHEDWCNILVMHGDLVSKDGKSAYNPIDRQMLADSGVTYAALGHIHKYSGMDRAGETTYAYPGFPEGRGFDELGPGGILVGDVEKGVLRAERMEVSARQFLEEKLDLSDCEDRLFAMEKLEKRLSEKGKEHLFRIILSGKADPDMVQGLMTDARRMGDVFYLELSNKTRGNYVIDDLKKEPTLRGAFACAMLEEMEKMDEADREIAKLALELGLHAMEEGVLS